MLFLAISSGTTLIFDIIFALLLCIIILALAIYNKVNWKVIGLIVLAAVLYLLAEAFELYLAKDMMLIAFGFLIIYCFFIQNKPEFDNFFKAHKHVKKKDKQLSTNETDALFANLSKAIADLSNSKTGALITIERHDDMEQFMRSSGVRVNAPVTPELLETIFFNKTPLHDGASIIKGNIIVSSAVFYQPTQKPLNGKYGSRHRAAIGISEMCDALTIVVSEETGKVSFAVKGELIPVPVSQFTDKLKEYYY